MNNDDRKFSNNSSQPNSSTANLPETRTGEGKAISSRSLIVISTVIFLVILLAGVAYVGLAYRKPTPKVGTTQFLSPSIPASPPVSPTLVVDRAEIPPLFPGLTIKQRQEGMMFKTEDLDGPLQIQGAEVEGNIRSLEDARLVLELVGYYNNYFAARGWDFYLSASGPTGDLEGWKRDGKYFIMEYSVDVHTGTRSAFLRYN